MEKPVKNSIEKQNDWLTSDTFMRRVYDVHAPCQWQHHCYDGKCRALLHIGGNLYCAREKV